MHMQRKTGVALLGLLAVLLGLGSACGGVSQQEYDAVKSQIAAKEQDLALAQQRSQVALAAKEQEVASIRQQIDEAVQAGSQQAVALQQQLSAKEAEIADLKKRTEYEVVLGAKQQPPPPPAPTATPVPPGFIPPTPAPAPTMPAQFLQPLEGFYFWVEPLAAFHPDNVYGYNFDCVLSSLMKRGTEIVWRFEVIDMATKKRITNLDEATIKVRLPHGEERVARYGKRAGVGPYMWYAAWDVPLDYPLGFFDYRILVTTKDGRTGEFKQDAFGISIPARGIDTRVTIVP